MSAEAIKKITTDQLAEVTAKFQAAYDDMTAATEIQKLLG